MCGIAGIVGPAEPDRIEMMTRVLQHRGPDSWGTQRFPQAGVALGHRRLSILDLSERGHQPMTDNQQRLWITFNGEIYNFQEVRRELEAKGHRFKSSTDTEVILYAYKEWGADCLQKLNGMFAFVIWDNEAKTLFGARDRVGIKPFYYYQSGPLFLFASEIKAILATGLVPKEVDFEALHTPALYQASPLTGFKGIYKLPPGHIVTLRDGCMSIRPYWSVKPREENPGLKSAVDQLDALIQDAVAGQMISDVPVGAFLSGGLDSSLIVALMKRHSNQPITTFTIRYSDADQKFERMADDSFYARKVAELFGCRHYEFTIEPKVTELLPKMIWHLDEPLSDPATINTYLISKAARENGIIVLLNGMAGDEVFGGYRSQLACLLANQYRAYVPEFARQMITSVVDRLPAATRTRGIRTTRWAKRFLSLASLPGEDRYVFNGMMDADRYRSMFAWVHTPEAGLFDHHHVRTLRRPLTCNGASYLTRMCLADTQVYLPDHNLTYSDKCTMAASVEGRPPLTDHRLLELMFSLGPSYRIRRTTQKYLLKKVGERHLPKEIIYRPKAPFGAPLRAWMRGGLAEMVSDYLSPATLRSRGLYNAKFVERAIQNDRAGKEDNAHLLWRLLCNELWFRTFFDDPAPAVLSR